MALYQTSNETDSKKKPCAAVTIKEWRIPDEGISVSIKQKTGHFTHKAQSNGDRNEGFSVFRSTELLSDYVYQSFHSIETVQC